MIHPYGGVLVQLQVTEDSARAELLSLARELPALQVSSRTLCDLELLATGAFSPLKSFLGEIDYQRVCAEMRLDRGTLFPIPITLPCPDIPGLKLDGEIALRDPRNEILAVLRVEEIYNRDSREAQLICGTKDTRHPLVSEMETWPAQCVSGELRVINLPRHYDFRELRHTPAQVRDNFQKLGHSRFVAFQTRNPMHRSHEEITKRALEQIDGGLLIHPTVGITRLEDIDYFTRIRCIATLVRNYYPADRTMLSILPLAMRMAGPREALWHMIIRRNYGASHFIIGRDHASPGKDSQDRPYYDPYAAQDLARKHEAELGVAVSTFNEMVYVEEEDRYEDVTLVPAGRKVLSISGTQIREHYLRRGKLLPEWYTRPETARILLRSFPSRNEQGFCIWFTGLPSAGKSTIAEILAVKLYEAGRRVTLLDGDIVRTHLSKGLGFSREDRDANILRIGFVASEIVRHSGVAICAAVSPYRATRDQVRNLFGEGTFFEVHVSTPLEVCAQRDVKGHYARAMRKELKGFTGVDDPYEAPISPELQLNTLTLSAEEAAGSVMNLLLEAELLNPSL